MEILSQSWNWFFFPLEQSYMQEDNGSHLKALHIALIATEGLLRHKGQLPVFLS